MATYIFELDGVTSANAAQVTAALNAIPGIKATLTRTALGNYIVTVDTALSESDAYDLLVQALALLGVTVKKKKKRPTPPTPSAPKKAPKP